MREIKFRAWVSDKAGYNKQGMYCGVENAYDTLGQMGDGKGGFKDYSWQSFEEVISDAKKGDLVLMQFTGLLDKNGKEIYEGDVVMKTVKDNGHAPIKMPVRWNQILAGFDINGKSGHEYEIIGNIYENPELLKS